jgi:hypothetical protein
LIDFAFPVPLQAEHFFSSMMMNPLPSHAVHDPMLLDLGVF